MQMSEIQKFMTMKINEQTQTPKWNYEREIQNLKNKYDQKCKIKRHNCNLKSSSMIGLNQRQMH